MSELMLTKSQQNALNAVAARNGTGIFDNNGVLVCAGERLGFMRGTWNMLRAIGLVTIEKKRLTLTDAGRAAVTDSQPRDDQIAIDDRFE